jgi:cytochrome c551/c552
VRNHIAPGIVLIVLLAVAGCGGQKAEPTPPPPAAAPAAFVPPADLDQGPRAGESAMDEALAAQGEKLFTARGCVACHAFGKTVVGPDLKGVAMQRTARWMEAQILHPVEMVQQDPISRELMTRYKTQMTNQGLTPDEAKAMVEYIKKAGR